MIYYETSAIPMASSTHLLPTASASLPWSSSADRSKRWINYQRSKNVPDLAWDIYVSGICRHTCRNSSPPISFTSCRMCTGTGTPMMNCPSSRHWPLQPEESCLCRCTHLLSNSSAHAHLIPKRIPLRSIRSSHASPRWKRSLWLTVA